MRRAVSDSLHRGRSASPTSRRAPACASPSVYGGDRSQAVHHRDQRLWRRAGRLRQRRLARCARAERDAARRGRRARTQQWPPGTAPTNRLYRNRHDGTFEDVTDARGPATGPAWASSVCAGDYDNDGWIDLFITYYGQQRAVSQSRRAGSRMSRPRPACRRRASRWGSGCTFIDYDRDGRLDLFVANYLRFDLAPRRRAGQGANCLWKGMPVNCGPKGLPTDTNLLYRNPATARSATCHEPSGYRRGHRALRDDRVGRRPRRRRLARHLRRVRLARPPCSIATTTTARSPTSRCRAAPPTARTATPQAGMGVAVGDYNGDGTARHPQDAFRRRHAGALPQPREGTVRGRGERGGARGREPVRRVGRRDCPTSTTTAGRTCSTSPATSIRRSSACCRSIRTAARASCSGTPAGAASRT